MIAVRCTFLSRRISVSIVLPYTSGFIKRPSLDRPETCVGLKYEYSKTALRRLGSTMASLDSAAMAASADLAEIVTSEAHASPLAFQSFVLDPACRAFIDRLGPPPDPESVPVSLRRAGLQAAMTSNSGTGPRVRCVEDLDAGGVPVRVYRSTLDAEAPSPCLVYFHGGGWNAGSVSDYDVQMRALTAAAAGVVVVSVEYRLAPESPAPAQIEDALAVLEWLHAGGGGRSLGVDPGRVAIGGDSAGGSITAAVTQALAAAAGSAFPPIALQLLVYPSLDLTCSSGLSYEQCARGYRIETAAVAFLGRSYAGPLPLADPRVSPLLLPFPGADGVWARLPRALIYSAGFDPLRRCGSGGWWWGARRVRVCCFCL